MVTDEGEATTEAQRRQRLVGARLVRLVEDDDVEVHVGDAGCRGGRAGGEIAVGFEQARVVLVVAAETIDGGVHPLGAGHPDGPHARGAGEALERVVDREVAVRGHQDPLVGIGGEPAFDGLDDDRRLARAGRSLNEDGLAGREPAQQSHSPVLRLVGDHPRGQPRGRRIRFVLGGDDGLRADQQLGEQADAEVLGRDGGEHRPFCLVERLVERRCDVSLAARMLERPSHDLDDVALMVDAGNASDEVSLVVGLDEHRGVGGEIDRLAGGDLKLHLADLRGFAVGVGELAAAGRAAFVALRPPERPARLAAPVLARSVEPGALRLRPLLLRPLETVDELERRVELFGPGRVLGRDPPVEQPERVADHPVRLGHHRLARGDGQELRAFGLATGGADRDDAEAEVLPGTVEPRLRDALEDEVGKVEAQLRRIFVAE